jgi:hypothetical protein
MWIGVWSGLEFGVDWIAIKNIGLVTALTNIFFTKIIQSIIMRGENAWMVAGEQGTILPI